MVIRDTWRKAVGLLRLVRLTCTLGLTASVTGWNVFSASTAQPLVAYLEVHTPKIIYKLQAITVWALLSLALA